MIVSDIYEDARDAFGKCDQAMIFRRMGDAINLLANKNPAWNPLIGYLEACVCNECVALPRDVKTPLTVAICDNPAFPRDRWFEFHINGPGPAGCTSKWFWDDRGEVPIFREITTPSRIQAILQTAQDDGKSLRIYGFDANDRELYTIDSSGVATEGILVPMNFASPQATPSSTLIKRITRIRRAETANFVQLFAIDPATSLSTLIGYYYPDEIEPRYRRIRVKSGTTVKMMYRRNTRDIRTMNDYVPIDSRMAMIIAMKSVREYLHGNNVTAEQLSAQATNLLNDEQGSQEIGSGDLPQINMYATTNADDRMYGRRF